MHITATASSVVGLAAADGESMPLIPHLEELIFGLVMFAILYFVVAKFVAPNIEKAYQERHAAIEGGIAQAENAQAEAEAAKAQDRKSTRLNSSHRIQSRMPSSA